jgi:hypothetical protein
VIFYILEDPDGPAQVVLSTWVSNGPRLPNGRRVVNVREAARAGVTHLTWDEFANTGQNPVRYIRRRLPVLAAQA